jgi:serum/glucocorticoid-regulated kinase 2
MQLGTAEADKKERVLMVTEIRHFSDRHEPTSLKLVVTKSKIILAHNETIIRDISLHRIDALTLSKTSPEFIIHVHHDSDERLAAPHHRKEIVEMLLYLLTYRRAEARSVPQKSKLYFVDNAKLDLYVTTSEDLEDGHLIRPDKKHMVTLDYSEFIMMEEAQSPASHPHTPAKTGHIAAFRLEDYRFVKTLGKGSHGKVLLAERLTDPSDQYAIKILKKKHVVESKQLEHTLTEKKILSTFSHPFLVSLQHAMQTDTKLYFVMEFLRGGELFQHLKRVVRFKEEQAKFFCACLVTAIGHLHNADYIYRDLKPENILLDDEGYIKLTDFGLAKHLKVSDLANTFCGTPEYLAPEIILNKGCNRAADWWSLGVLTYEMLFGAPPFYTKDVQEMYKRTLLNQVKFPSKINVSRAGLDFIAGLLVKVPSRRLGSVADALEVMNHPWFAGFDWKALLARKMTPPFIPQNLRWEVNFDPDFIKEEPRDSKCEMDEESLAQLAKDFALFSEEEKQSPLLKLNLDIKLGAIFRENLMKDIQAELHKPKEAPTPAPQPPTEEETPPAEVPEHEIDKENPNRKTPAKPKIITPKKPFSVIYASPKSVAPDFDLSSVSKEEDLKGFSSLIHKKD